MFPITVGHQCFRGVIGLGLKKGSMLAPFLARIEKINKGHINQL